MPDTRYLLLAVGISAAVNWALRAVPFGLLGMLRTSRVVQYLGARMPAGVMVVLLVYCLRDLAPSWSSAVAPLAALVVTVALYLWRRNALLSIVAGTAVNVLLASTFFAS
ncbi:branched-chain amino acid transporter permease [Kitasatospora sp. NPDC057542]|uniref:branched-chain amino acid transporter permease n=1 Tax=Streptomycetaceae TaxID=2062 RepID=UPI001CCA36AA|nr:AzlD domain-containing protein [Streptomyces sp. LS1784]